MAPTFPHDVHQNIPSKPVLRPRLRTSNACHPCRLRKVKCDGSRPACARYSAERKTCPNIRSSSAAIVSQQVKHKRQVEDAVSFRSHVPIVSASPPACRPSFDTPLTPGTDSTTSTSRSYTRPELVEEEKELDTDNNRAYYTAHGRFAGEVAAAIDVRAGLAPAATSNLVPFVDAPLFGEIDLHAPYRVLNFAAELPPRAYADILVGIYWQYVHPMEPILDRELFFRDYNALYSKPGEPLNADRDIWLSILNVVFALAVQRQESMPLQKRDQEGNRYFQHAWALLRPEAVLWTPGSLELVQCLMLMNRYLHCTNNQQKTWMTAGLAIRIAQSLCCHLPEPSSEKEASQDHRLRRKVWASCVALDRCVSWSLGRTSAPSLIPLPSRANSTPSRSNHERSGENSDQITRGLELFEIGSQIQLAQTQTRNSVANKLGLPRLYQQDEYHAVAVQLEACLNKWEHDLPNDWKLQNLRMVSDKTSKSERCLLHLRLLHTRIFLYRPLLARFYSVKTHTPTAGPPESRKSSSLSDRLLKECAAMCVETAQRVTSLIIDTLEPGESIGLLPWWYRIYYLHIAGITFLAAMFTPELFDESISQSWRDVMSTLRSHVHLSAYVQQCIAIFETLSTRILETRKPKSDGGESVQPDEGADDFLMEDIFQDFGLDFNNYLFGTDDFFDIQ
ncbi:hypothetical protein QQS21_002516 [Conoideocrella luteorostrata]|uniref:Zn(2)-C6 fungal-type domain-containing protein n=1 Tax=Conoideocrella luteorostrata TaxID=1105319 RepID=A0AAJ0CV29_9HYPO|nr:hypothetical protein QQS21_002516 [Conoideocrella luteorostrata]